MNGHDSIILAAGSNVVTSALDLFSQFAIIGGGLWAVWAVYAARDLHKDGAVITAKGDKLAGSGFDSEKFGGDLFTLDYKDGTAVITATDAYRALVSADVEHENDWTAYIQCKRIKTAGRVENRFTEHFNDKGLESNVVWTRTPDMTPGLHLEKYDVKSGERLGDRDDVKQALKMDGDSLEIAFKITNTSKVDSSTGEGAWFRARDLKLTDDPTGERSARPFSIPSSEPLRVRRERPNRSLLDGHTVVMSSKTSRKETIMYGTTIAADSGSVVTSALQLFSQFAIIGGGLWAVWGVVTLAGGLKDQNGPATQSGVWQVVGGGLIIAAAALFSNIAL